VETLEEYFGSSDRRRQSLLYARWIGVDGSDRVALNIVPVEDNRNSLQAWLYLPSDHHPSWAPAVAGARFRAEPNETVLAEQLRWLASVRNGEDPWYFITAVPWPLQACLRGVRTKCDLEELAGRAARGELGSLDTWKKAERRWTEEGITDADFQAMTDERWPYDADIWRSGFPFAAASWSRGSTRSEYDAGEWIGLFRSAHNRLKEWTAEIVTIMLMRSPFGRGLGQIPSPLDARALFEHAPPWLAHPMLENLVKVAPESYRTNEGLELIASLGEAELFPMITEFDTPYAEYLLHAFCVSPERLRGLLPLIVSLAMAGFKVQIPTTVLDSACTWGGHFRSNATLMLASRAEWTLGDVDAWAHRLLADVNPRYIWPAVRFLQRQLPQERFAELITAMIRTAADQGNDYSTDIINVLVDALTEYLTKRPSGLDNPIVWKRLDLPEKI